MRRALRGDGARKRRGVVPWLFVGAGVLSVTAIAIAVARHHSSPHSQPAPVAKPDDPWGGSSSPAIVDPTLPPLIADDQRTVDLLRKNAHYMKREDLRRAMCGAEHAAAAAADSHASRYQLRFALELVRAYRSDSRLA